MYLKNLLIGVDQLINTVFAGAPDETMSARAWRMEYESKLPGKILRPLIDALFFFDPNHCQSSFESERTRNQLPKIYTK